MSFFLTRVIHAKDSLLLIVVLEIRQFNLVRQVCVLYIE